MSCTSPQLGKVQKPFSAFTCNVLLVLFLLLLREEERRGEEKREEKTENQKEEFLPSERTTSTSTGVAISPPVKMAVYLYLEIHA